MPNSEENCPVGIVSGRLLFKRPKIKMDGVAVSLDVIKDQIRSFLKSKAPEVLAIRGDWGVGKTFTWDQVLNECQQEKIKSNPDAIGLNYYSYVSLFGVTTLQDLRTEIAFNKLNTLDLKHAEGVTRFQKNTSKFLPGIITQALKYTGINAGTLIDTLFSSMSNSMIKNTIICIDDFERSTIGEKEALGFINDLAKKRGCKIVLLLNDRNTVAYKTYREKVIDYDVEFKISPIETVNLITKDSDDELIELVRVNCIKIGITNLRIIIKLLKLLKQAKEQHRLDDYIPDIKIQFVNTLTLAAYCFYGHDENAPSVDFLLDLEARHSIHVLRLIEEKHGGSPESEAEQAKSELYKKWDNFLNLYGYYETDSFDETIIESVVSGYIDRDIFVKTANQKQKLFLDDEAAQDIKSAIETFYTLLMNEKNEDHFSNHLVKCMLENIENARPHTLNESYKLLKRLKRKQSSKAILESYIETHSGKPEFFTFEDSARRLEWDEDLKDSMEQNYKDALRVQPAIETFKRLLNDNNPIPSYKDVASLDYLNEGEIEDLLRSSQFDNFKKTIKLLLILNSHDTKLNHIYKNTIKVLQKIAKESEQKKMLVEHYGIAIEY